jgi:cellulose biosynthesis protein BcsQ
MKTIALFNNKGGVGKTSLVYHLAWMYARRGLPVLAADLQRRSRQRQAVPASAKRRAPGSA